MRVSNVFGRVCLSVCPSVQTITFEPLDIETSFLVCRYILTISRSGLSIKVIGLRSRSYEKKMIILLISTYESSIYGYRSLMRSRSHIKVKVTPRSKYFLSNFMPNFTYFNTLFLCVWLQVINKGKFIHQGEGHIKVKEKYLHPFKFYVAHTFCKQVVCIRLNAFLFSLNCDDTFTPTETGIDTKTNKLTQYQMELVSRCSMINSTQS